MKVYLIKFYEFGYGNKSTDIIFADREEAKQYCKQKNLDEELNPENGDRYIVSEVTVR